MDSMHFNNFRHAADPWDLFAMNGTRLDMLRCNSASYGLMTPTAGSDVVRLAAANAEFLSEDTTATRPATKGVQLTVPEEWHLINEGGMHAYR